jgi:hypothetical protein
MKGIPKIVDVKPSEEMIVTVTFDGDIVKNYDVKPLLNQYEIFSELKNKALFDMVRVDCGGFGISWNDEIDLSEYEIWGNGILVN